MFTTSGIGIISKDDEITTKQYNNSVYFDFTLITKNPYTQNKEKRSYLKVSLRVNATDIEKAKEIIQAGNFMQVRIGELSGYKSDKGYIYMKITTRLEWVEKLKALPTKERVDEL